MRLGIGITTIELLRAFPRCTTPCWWTSKFAYSTSRSIGFWRLPRPHTSRAACSCLATQDPSAGNQAIFDHWNSHISDPPRNHFWTLGRRRWLFPACRPTPISIMHGAWDLLAAKMSPLHFDQRHGLYSHAHDAVPQVAWPPPIGISGKGNWGPNQTMRLRLALRETQKLQEIEAARYCHCHSDIYTYTQWNWKNHPSSHRHCYPKSTPSSSYANAP